MQLTTNFHLREFVREDCKRVPSKYIGNIQLLAENLQIIRNTIKKPIYITSGYRTPEHNKSVGGGIKSQHLVGKAADMYVAGMFPKELHYTIEKLIQKGSIKQGGLGLYGTFIHYDIRGSRARWQR